MSKLEAEDVTPSRELLIDLREIVRAMQAQLATLATQIDLLLDARVLGQDSATTADTPMTSLPLGVDTPWIADQLPTFGALTGGAATDTTEAANGVDFHTGRYLLKLPPSAVDMARRQTDEPELIGLHNEKLRENMQKLGVVSGIDPDNLSQCRWAIVVNGAEPAALLKALTPLIAHRAEQQGISFSPQLLTFGADETCAAWYSRVVKGVDEHIKHWFSLPPVLIYHVETGRPETARGWLARHGVAMGPVTPWRGVPFYLLLVGRPGPLYDGDNAYMPFEFQYELDLQWGVGRICFTTDDGQHNLEDYTTYAQRVVQFERTSDAAARLRKEIVFFGTCHPGDQATVEAAEHLIAPLSADWHANPLTGIAHFGFTQRLFLGDGGEQPYTDGRSLNPIGDAGRENLGRLLTGGVDGRPPAILFLSGHGAGLQKGTVAEYVRFQGALLTQGWKGEGDDRREHWFTSADLDDSTKVEGMVAFLFACFAAGSPYEDQFVFDEQVVRPRITPFALVARLPQRLLLCGSLAVLGHVDRAWSFAFREPVEMPHLPPGKVRKLSRQSQQFEHVLGLIAAGKRLGFATDDFNMMQSLWATTLVEKIEQMKFGKRTNPVDLMRLWKARNDTRNFVLLGDPAVRLPFGP